MTGLLIYFTDDDGIFVGQRSTGYLHDMTSNAYFEDFQKHIKPGEFYIHVGWDERDTTALAIGHAKWVKNKSVPLEVGCKIGLTPTTITDNHIQPLPLAYSSIPVVVSVTQSTIQEWDNKIAAFNKHINQYLHQTDLISKRLEQDIFNYKSKIEALNIKYHQ